MVNSTRVPVYISHTPAGTSNWAVLHYLQLVKHNKFAKMDYGKKENMKRYGQVIVNKILQQISLKNFFFLSA